MLMRIRRDDEHTQLVKGMEELGPFSSVLHFWVNVSKWNKTYAVDAQQAFRHTIPLL